MRYLKSIFQAAVVTGALALGAAASHAMPLAQSPAPAAVDAAKASNGIVDVRHRTRYSRWCYRNPRACDRRRYGYRRNYYRPYYYPRYYGYNRYYYPRYYYPRYYGYDYPYYGYTSPGVGLFFSF